jgi:hypothetical protein
VSVRSLNLWAVLAAVALGPAGGAALVHGQVAPPAAPAPAAPLSPDAPIATINGRDVNNAAFDNLMLQVAGMRVFQQVFDLTLVQRACADAGIPTDGPDFDARIKTELQRTLDGMNVQGAREEDKPRILEEVLRRQGVTNIEFRMGLERQAGLRALSKGKIEVSDKDIDEAYIAQYDERVTARVFTVGTTDKAAALREAIEKQHKAPEVAAQELGLPAAASYTISKNASQIEAIRDVAFSKSVGELSAPLTFNNQLIMLFVDKKEPSRLATVSKASVKEDLRKFVQNFKETQWMNTHLARLRADATVTINNPILKQQFDAVFEQLKKQAGAAAPAAPAAAAPH